MSTGLFPRWWSERYGEAEPLGHRLRIAFSDRWFRIHSLPNSKRYPANAYELEQLLERQDAVARAVLTSECRLIVPRYELSKVGATGFFESTPGRRFECVHAMRQSDRGPDELVDISFWSTRCRWDANAERAALVAIAKDAFRALWMDAGSGEVFAPYDGGVDIIASNSARRDGLKARFSDWHSPRADGL